jgi:hypothetical protein
VSDPRHPNVHDVIDAPELGLDVPAREAAAMLAKLEAASAVLRVAAACAHETNGHEPEPGPLLTVKQAAALANMSPEEFYRRRRFEPAKVRLGHRTVRVSERKLRRILGGT